MTIFGKMTHVSAAAAAAFGAAAAAAAARVFLVHCLVSD